MTDIEQVLTPTQKAYRVIGQALWKTVCRKDDCTGSDCPPYLYRLMQALADSDDRGSVCVQWTENDNALLSPKEIDELKEFRLIAEKPHTLGESSCSEIPFVIDREGSLTRIYMQRHFTDEAQVAQKILTLSQKDDQPLSSEVMQSLERFNQMNYGQSASGDKGARFEQQNAVAKALQNQFFIITGGPGTGKTTVVAKLLECLLITKPDLKIALAAPTGKATSRIMQSLQGSCERFPEFFPHVLKRIQTDSLPARTIHKWLLTRNAKDQMPSAKSPLDIDVMIVDEASMIDLRLAKRLFSVINPVQTRLILLGDKYQLSAVGPGSVLADMTQKDGALKDHLAELTISHRFTSDSNVGLLAQAIKTARTPFDTQAFIDRFKAARIGKDQVSIHIYRGNNYVDRSISKWVQPHLKAYLKALDLFLKGRHSLLAADALLDRLWKEAESFRILCAVREGANGVNAVNDLIEDAVREHVGANANAIFYSGRLVIIRKNTPTLDIYNGDVGIVIPQTDDDTRFDLYIGDRKKRIPVGLLPEHDTAFAMTIHQSQGSQFEHVAVLLPMTEDNPLATRELFYTGVTRAQKEAAVFASKQSLEVSAVRNTERASGLADRLLQK